MLAKEPNFQNILSKNMNGKLVGAILGAIFWGMPGFFFGLIAGYFYDSFKSFSQSSFTRIPAQERELIHRSYFETNFKLLGYLAKADGRVSEEEIFHTERLMDRMRLSPDQRQEAIAFFKLGAAADFSLQTTLDSFNQICSRQARLKQALLSYLITLALADGHLDNKEKIALEQIAKGLGIPAFVFEQMLNMIQAQAGFRQQQGQGHSYSAASQAQDLDKAYQALGVEASATDSEIKKAYRKLISENHPDKLIGQGMPEEMVKLATERSQEISTAYEIIQKARGK